MIAFRKACQTNAALGDPFRPGRPDVVLAQHLQHAGARQPGDHRNRGKGQGHGRQHQVSERDPASPGNPLASTSPSRAACRAAWRTSTISRMPTQNIGTLLLTMTPEHREAIEDRLPDRTPRAGPGRCRRPTERTSAPPARIAVALNFWRTSSSTGRLSRIEWPRSPRIPPAEPRPELIPEWLVEPELLAEGVDRLRSRLRTEHHQGGIARHQVHDHEHDAARRREARPEASPAGARRTPRTVRRTPAASTLDIHPDEQE